MAIVDGLSSLESILGDLGIISYIGNAIYQITQQEQCIANYAGDLVNKNPGSNEIYAIYPSLISPYEFSASAVNPNTGSMRSYFNDINHIVRHGILVRTSRGGKTFLVFIGGYDEGWANSVYSVRIYNGGNSYKAKFTSSLVPKIFNSNSGLIVIPTTAKGNQYWVNFRDPVHQVCKNIQLNQAGQEIDELIYGSIWQRIVQLFTQAPQEFSKLINVVTFAGVMNYVLQIQAFLLTSFDFIVKHNGAITYNSTSNYWILDPLISNYLRSISDMPPSMTLGFNFLRKLEDIFSMSTILALPNRPMTLDYASVSSFNLAIQLATQINLKLSNFPIIVGSPVLGSEVCTTECDDSQALIGFVSKHLLPELPAPGNWSEYQYEADLMVPPPRSYTWDDIMAWAQTQGQDVSALNITADAIAVIQSAIEKVAQETGSTVEELEGIGQDIAIGAEIIEKGVENVATDIYNIIKGL